MRKFFVVLMVMAMLSALSFAQVRGGDIYGALVLADGSKVPGVMITITGDLIGKKTTISTDQGNFRFLDLPPGAYDLKLELEGFKTVVRKGVEVSLGKTVSLNILMETSTLKEEVTVIGKVGTIDMRKTTVGVNVSKEVVDSIPTARNPWTVLSTIPGIMLDRVDVGGADSGQQSNFMAGGGNVDDTTWNVDGANITDPSAIGAAPAYLNINAYQEVQITLGANDITAQTGGVQLNYVTKRAGNKHSGDFHLYVEDKAWEMNQTPTPYMVSRGYVIPGVNRLYQYGVGLGGPLINDKLWWYGSWAIQDIVKRGESGATDSTWLVSAYAKLNFQLCNTSGDFHFSHDAKKKWGRTALSPAQQNDGSLWDQDGPGYIVYGGLSHVFGELMLNAKAVYTKGGFTLDPRGDTVNPVSGHNEGNDWRYMVDETRYLDGLYHYITDRRSLDASMDGNYFLEGFIGGNHEIKFGVDYFTADTTTQTLYPNQRIVYIYNNPASNYLGIYPDFVLDVNFYRISGYIQDTMTFGKLTAAIGIRYDKEQGGLNPFEQPYYTYYEPGSPHHGERMYSDYINALNISSYKVPSNWNLISPRFSLTYDITGDGKNVVKLSAGRYMSQSGNNMASNFVPSRYGYAYWTDANHDNRVQYAEVGELFKTDRLTNIDPVTGRKIVQYAPDYNTPMLDELTLTFEKALMEDLSVSLTGFYKKRHNLTDDVSSKGEQWFIRKGIMNDGTIETAANWHLITSRVVGGQPVTTWDQIELPLGDYYYNYKNAYYKYIGGTLQVNKKLANHWMANFSVTVQDWKRHLDRSEIMNLNNFDFFDGGQVGPSTTGSGLTDIWVNSKWMVKFTGMYQLPMGFNFTTFFQARQGYPQPLRRRFMLNQGTLYLYQAGKKAGDDRLPTFWMLNLGLEKNIKVSDTVSATLVVDWYNATNNQIELKRTLNASTSTQTTLSPTMWSNAGLFQFGIRVNF